MTVLENFSGTTAGRDDTFNATHNIDKPQIDEANVFFIQSLKIMSLLS